MFTEFKNIDTPALLIEKSRLEENINEMQKIANENHVKLRPHSKTHKMPFIAKIQLNAGANGITVAKVSEAEVMAGYGIKDILIANEVIGDTKIRRLAELSHQTDNIACCVDSLEGVNVLSDIFNQINREINIFIEIDTGLHRCGLSSFEDILKLCKNVEKLDGIVLKGILTHAGHVYTAKNGEEVREIGRYEVEFMVDLAEKLKSQGIDVKEISIGSSPAAKLLSKFPGITEIRPGNYVFNDMTQVSLGSAEISHCSLSVLATVISTPSSNRAVIDAGSKSLNLDKVLYGDRIHDGHGYIYNKYAIISRLSEEHGMISFDNETFTIGEKIRIIPNHACTVVNLYDYAYLVDGKNVLEEIHVSCRGNQQLVSNGLDLGSAMKEVSTKLGGHGGGHAIASGATLSLEKEEEFLEMVEEIISKQMKK